MLQFGSVAVKPSRQPHQREDHIDVGAASFYRPGEMLQKLQGLPIVGAGFRMSAEVIGALGCLKRIFQRFFPDLSLFEMIGQHLVELFQPVRVDLLDRLSDLLVNLLSPFAKEAVIRDLLR